MWAFSYVFCSNTTYMPNKIYSLLVLPYCCGQTRWSSVKHAVPRWFNMAKTLRKQRSLPPRKQRKRGCNMWMGKHTFLVCIMLHLHVAANSRSWTALDVLQTAYQDNNPSLTYTLSSHAATMIYPSWQDKALPPWKYWSRWTTWGWSQMP